MKILTKIFIVALALTHTLSIAGDKDPRFKAVQKYLSQKDDYPELFKNKPYRVKVEGIAIGDLDADGQAEVALQLKPHYRQSPTIVIFRVDNNMKVTRVVEGLAPGPLIPVSGDYLDSHTLGLGVDVGVKIDDKKIKVSKEKILNEMINTHGGVVKYSNWYHLDHRLGKKMYIDMSHAEAYDDKHNCEGFEFSTVKHIQMATRKGKPGLYLLALVGKTLYAYKINKFLENGLMEKTLEVFPGE